MPPDELPEYEYVIRFRLAPVPWTPVQPEIVGNEYAGSPAGVAVRTNEPLPPERKYTRWLLPASGTAFPLKPDSVTPGAMRTLNALLVAVVRPELVASRV